MYVTDKTIQNGSSESIYGFRSVGGTNGYKPKSTCDIKITAYDPLDFQINYKSKFVNVREYYTNIHGRRKYRVRKVLVPYPFYVFKKKTRTVKQWRIELSAAKKVLKEVPPECFKTCSRYLKFLEKKLRSVGNCRPMAPKPVHIQNQCIHWKTTISGFSGDRFLYPPGVTVNERSHAINAVYRYRAVHFDHEEFVGTSTAAGDSSTLDVMFTYTANISRLNELGNPDARSFLTAVLWPSTDDFASRDASPLVDLAEAASDGVFPLGPPPDAFDAHERMVNNVLSDKRIGALTEAIDFAANTWLWTTLVLEPVYSSAVGLAASVQANDDAIEHYQSLVNKGKWVQGKSIRIYGTDPGQVASDLGLPKSHTYSEGYDGHLSTKYSYVKHSFDYKKFEANAMLVYKPSFAAAANMNSSGQRLSSFFNRLSTDLDKVLYNIVTLSFVADWFTTSFSGKLNLEDKVYMPVDDWKLITSFAFEMPMRTTTLLETYRHRVLRTHRTTRNGPCDSWDGFTGSNLKRQADFWNNYYVKSTASPGSITWCAYTNLGYPGMLEVKQIQNLEAIEEGEIQEDHSYYKRYVDKPPLPLNPSANSFSDYFEAYDHVKSEPLSGGQTITLSALIWGFIT